MSASGRTVPTPGLSKRTSSLEDRVHDHDEEYGHWEGEQCRHHIDRRHASTRVASARPRRELFTSPVGILAMNRSATNTGAIITVTPPQKPIALRRIHRTTFMARQPRLASMVTQGRRLAHVLLASPLLLRTQHRQCNEQIADTKPGMRAAPKWHACVHRIMVVSPSPLYS